MTTFLAAMLLVLTQDKIQTEKGDLTIHPIEHATFVMKWDGKTIFVDPTKGGDAFKAFGKPDLILVTDIHGDHFDPKTLAAVRTPESTLIVPAAVAEKMGADKGNAKILANGEKTKVGDIEIEGVPMYNLTEERKNFHTKGRGNGYVLTLGARRVYIAGDTECTDEMRALKNIDVAFVPMNLPYTMPTGEAAECVKAFKPKVVFPYHYRGQNPEEFKTALQGEPIEVRLLKWY